MAKQDLVTVEYTFPAVTIGSPQNIKGYSVIGEWLPHVPRHDPCDLYCEVCAATKAAKHIPTFRPTKLESNCMSRGLFLFDRVNYSNYSLLPEVKPEGWRLDIGQFFGKPRRAEVGEGCTIGDRQRISFEGAYTGFLGKYRSGEKFELVVKVSGPQVEAVAT